MLLLGHPKSGNFFGVVGVRVSVGVLNLLVPLNLCIKD